MLYRKYILLTKKECPYCEEAVEILSSRDIEYCEIDLQESPQILDHFKDAFEHNTVPMVLGSFGAGLYKLVGGCDDLKRTLVVENE